MSVDVVKGCECPNSRCLGWIDVGDMSCRKCGAVRDSAKDPVSFPAHYNQGGIECIDAIRSALSPAEFVGFCKGNAIKYTWRSERKGGPDDLRKAAWYIAFLLFTLGLGVDPRADRK